MNLFNEIEPFAAAWLRTLYQHAHVETRSIADLNATDVAGFRRVHFFAGIGGWEEALRIAGWPEEREIWTGSCPCQPFSVAGKRGGTADERHLWPEMFRLIRDCHPATAMGEQVSSKDGLLWLDGVFDDLEAEGYTCWAVDTCAAGVSAPHIRQRLYWLAYASKSERGRRPIPKGRRKRIQHAANGDAVNRLANAPKTRHARAGGGAATDGGRANSLPQRRVAQREPAGSGEAHRLVLADRNGQQQGRTSGEAARYGSAVDPASCANAATADRLGDTSGTRPQERQDGGRGTADLQHQAAIGAGTWGNYRIEQLTDGTTRRIESSIFALAYGIPRDVGPIVAELGKLGFDSKTARRIIANARRNRTGRLRGYGNAIVPQVAVEFIRSFMEASCN